MAGLQTLQPGETDTFKIVAVVRQLVAAFSGGQIPFPATQITSTDPNTLDDYEEGTWEPTLTFATPGDLAVVYSSRLGRYTKIGRLVVGDCSIVTSTFTHASAAGACTITGWPFVAGFVTTFPIAQWQGITKANYTQVGATMGLASTATLAASGSAQNISPVTTADMPTGGTVNLLFNFSFVT